MIKNATINSYLMGDGTQVTILNALGFASPRVENNLYSNAGRHGSQLPNSYWRERRLRLELGLRESAIASYATLRTDLLKAFGLPRTGNATFYFDTIDGKSLQIDVGLANEIDAPFEKGHLTIGKARVELVAPNPYMYDQTLQEDTISLPVAGGTAIPTVIPLSLGYTSDPVTLNNTGNGIYKPTITIDGPVENPTILNATTGEQFTVSGTYAGADQIVIDCEAETVTLNGVSNILSLFSGDFIDLRPDSNQINFSSATYDANALATIAWRISYLSI